MDRMKITALKAWKGTLKETDSLAKVKDGMKMAMIGTSVGLPKAPEESKVGELISTNVAVSRTAPQHNQRGPIS